MAWDEEVSIDPISSHPQCGASANNEVDYEDNSQLTTVGTIDGCL